MQSGESTDKVESALSFMEVLLWVEDLTPYLSIFRESLKVGTSDCQEFIPGCIKRKRVTSSTTTRRLWLHSSWHSCLLFQDIHSHIPESTSEAGGSVTYQTTNVLLLTHELKYIGPSQNPPECITLIIACVDIAFRCKTHKAHVEFCILLLWQIQRDEAIFPPPSGYSVVSLQCFSVLLICKISFSAALAIWNSLSVPLCLINFPFICSFQLTECCLCCWCLLTSSSLTGLMTRYLACLNIIVLLAVMDSILSWVIACWD